MTAFWMLLAIWAALLAATRGRIHPVRAALWITGLTALVLVFGCERANGQCGPAGCPMPGRGVGIGVGIGVGGWRASPRSDPLIPVRPAPAQAVRIANRLPTATVYASGTLIRWRNTPLIVTCRHTFERGGVGSVSVAFGGGQPMSARVVGIDQSADLAALSIEGAPVEPLDVTSGNPMEGDELSGGGFGPDGQWRWIVGRCVGYVRDSPTSRARSSFDVTSPAREGDSGGPMLNQAGELCGVIWGTDGKTTTSTYSGKIRAFLDRVCPSAPAGPAAQTPAVPTQAPPATQAETPAAPPKRDPPADRPASDLPERLERLGERLGSVADKLGQAGAEAAAPSLTTALITALGLSGPPAIAVAALPWLIALVRRRRERADQKASTSATPATQPKTFAPTGGQKDYVAYWAEHAEGTGTNLQQEAARGPLYVEALDLLRDGRIAVSVDPVAIAGAVEDFVHQQICRYGAILPQCEVREAAYVGHLYREAVEWLRTNKLRASGFGETADVLHGHVARQFLLRVHRVPNVNFLPGGDRK